jgi:hypothetical protein
VDFTLGLPFLNRKKERERKERGKKEEKINQESTNDFSLGLVCSSFFFPLLGF